MLHLGTFSMFLNISSNNSIELWFYIGIIYYYILFWNEQPNSWNGSEIKSLQKKKFLFTTYWCPKFHENKSTRLAKTVRCRQRKNWMLLTQVIQLKNSGTSHSTVTFSKLGCESAECGKERECCMSERKKDVQLACTLSFGTLILR